MPLAFVSRSYTNAGTSPHRQRAVVVTLIAAVQLFPAVARAQFPISIKKPTIPFRLPDLRKIGNQAASKAVGAILNNELPIRLDSNSTLPIVTTPPGGPFRPSNLTLTSRNLTELLAPGDYSVSVIAFCTEYSVHRPGQGIAYALAPLLGRNADAIATMLWRGILAGRNPAELQAVAWSIQSGLTYSKLPRSYRVAVDELMPEYRYQLNGNFLQDAEDRYQTFARANGNLPSLDALLAAMGKPGELALAAKRQQESLLRQNITDEIRTQTLYVGQNSVVAAPVRAEEGPWSELISGVAYARFKIVQGNLGINTIELRIVRPAATAFAPSRPIAAFMTPFQPTARPSASSTGLSVASLIGGPTSGPSPRTLNVRGLIGYPRGQAAQALIPVPAIAAQPDPCTICSAIAKQTNGQPDGQASTLCYALIGALEKLSDYRAAFIRDHRMNNLFPTVYYNVTAAELNRLAAGEFSNPVGKMQQMLAFFDAYQWNRDRAASGTAEPHWQAYYDKASAADARISRILLPEIPPTTVPTQVFGVLNAGIDAHVRYDLPRALRSSFTNLSPQQIQTLLPDFRSTNQTFVSAVKTSAQDIFSAFPLTETWDAAPLNPALAGFWDSLFQVSQNVVRLREQAWSIASSDATLPTDDEGHHPLPTPDHIALVRFGKVSCASGGR